MKSKREAKKNTIRNEPYEPRITYGTATCHQPEKKNVGSVLSGFPLLNQMYSNGTKI